MCISICALLSPTESILGIFLSYFVVVSRFIKIVQCTNNQPSTTN